MRYQLDLALDRPGAVALLLCCAIAAGMLFWPMSRMFRWQPAWTLLALLALAPILVFTAPLEAPGWQDGAVYRLGGYVRSLLHAATFHAELQAPASSDESLANLLLFIPLGVAGALATRHAVWTAAAGAALSFGIEGWQAVSGVRVASATDWLYNSGGTVIGATVGLIILLALRLAQPDAPAPVSPAVPATSPPVETWSRTLVLTSVPVWSSTPPPARHGDTSQEPTLDFSRAHEEMTTARLTRW
ncbi:VanZ family protein [Actinoplanes sp. NPDC051346]|uniref:VanZ family protein n=1 Tax=Actinoplanes sp. NPDC051346 TaxID=3155048 RepID=UPI00342487AB